MRVLKENGVLLRAVTIDDASFILGLRADGALGRHLSKTEGGLAGQVSFLKRYQKENEGGLQYYFIIQHNGKDVGTVRIYDVDSQQKTFTWGSWIVKAGNPGFVAITSAYLSYLFAFNELKMQKAIFDVRKENFNARRIYEAYANKIGEDDLNVYFEFLSENLNVFEQKFERLLFQ